MTLSIHFWSTIFMSVVIAIDRRLLYIQYHSERKFKPAQRLPVRVQNKDFRDKVCAKCVIVFKLPYSGFNRVKRVCRKMFSFDGYCMH